MPRTVNSAFVNSGCSTDGAWPHFGEESWEVPEVPRSLPEKKSGGEKRKTFLFRLPPDIDVGYRSNGRIVPAVSIRVRL